MGNESLVEACSYVGGSVANVILTASGFSPPLPETPQREDAPMAEQVPFPKTLFSKDEQQNPVTDSVTGEVLCGSRAFQSQAEVDAAGGNAVWHETPATGSRGPAAPAGGAARPAPWNRPAPADHGPPASAASA